MAWFGQRLLEQLQASASNLEITVLCEESRPAYDRVHLTSYFSGKKRAGAVVDRARFFFARTGISPQVCPSARSPSIASGVWSEPASGLSLEYDRVVLATGSYPFVPPITGARSSRLLRLPHHR